MKITSRQIEEIAFYLASRQITNLKKDLNIELDITECEDGVIRVENLLGAVYLFDREGEYPEEYQNPVQERERLKNAAGISTAK